MPVNQLFRKHGISEQMLIGGRQSIGHRCQRSAESMVNKKVLMDIKEKKLGFAFDNKWVYTVYCGEGYRYLKVVSGTP